MIGQEGGEQSPQIGWGMDGHGVRHYICDTCKTYIGPKPSEYETGHECTTEEDCIGCGAKLTTRELHNTGLCDACEDGL